jgi:DNA-binding NarL/FixJ family response regulator
LRRAVIVDPHPLWLDAVERVLAGVTVDVIARCASYEEALELVRTETPDLLVTELPSDPVDYLREARGASPSTKVIALTASEEVELAEAVLRAGATAYVIKTALPDDFAAAVRQTVSHSVFLPAGTHNGDAAHGEGAAGPNGNGNGKRLLTERERQTLALVAEGASNAEVGQALWVTEQTVKFHLSNIYKKLGVANRTEAGRWADRNGLLDETRR